MLTHLPILEAVAEEKKHTFISTGMSSFEDIDRAVAVFKKHQCPFTLLHCVSAYPSEDNESNLLVMNELKQRYKSDVGYSGHERGDPSHGPRRRPRRRSDRAAYHARQEDVRERSGRLDRRAGTPADDAAGPGSSRDPWYGHEDRIREREGNCKETPDISNNLSFYNE